MKTENPIADKSKGFAIEIVLLYKGLCSNKKEFVLSKQLLRCGTSIGANVHEATRAQSHADFLSKMSIALKECQETEYWLDIMHETGLIDESDFSHLSLKNAELLCMLTAICKTASDNT